jgi:hypothetical protein
MPRVILIYKIAFTKYRKVIMSVVILFSIIGIFVASGEGLRGVFFGLGATAALMNFGESMAEINKQKANSDVSKFNNQ